MNNNEWRTTFRLCSPFFIWRNDFKLERNEGYVHVGGFSLDK